MLILLGCRDPALAPFGEAIEAWEAGKEKLEAGEAAAAEEEFVRARAKDPGSAALAVWEAKALADQGRVEEAATRLSDVLQHQADGVARYNRAAYRTRLGRYRDAAEDLRLALEAKVTTAWEAAADPDFAPHLGNPAFAGLLPESPVRVTATGPSGTVWFGGTVEIVIVVEGLAVKAARLVREGEDPGCLRLDKVVEESHAEGAVESHRLTLRHVAVAPCVARFAWQVHADDRLQRVQIPVTVEAPPGAARLADARMPLVIPLPSLGSAGELEMGDATWKAETNVPVEWRVDGNLRGRGGLGVR